MKIKCPICPRLQSYSSYQQLGNHINSHKDRDRFGFIIAEQIFKIHEKIEFYKEHKKYNTKGGLSRQTIIFDFRIAEILESLLQE